MPLCARFVTLIAILTYAKFPLSTSVFVPLSAGGRGVHLLFLATDAVAPPVVRATAEYSVGSEPENI